jgi:hypothetical protein
MTRVWLCSFVGLVLPGCSLILDFSDSAAPHDAALPDAPYTQAECAYDEPNDSIDTAATVTTADAGPAAICPTSTGTDDLDFYRFEVPDMTAQVTIQLAYVPRQNGSLALTLYDDTESVIASETDTLATKTIACPTDATSGATCPVLVAGTYTFEVAPLDPGDVNDYSFSLTIAAGSDLGSGSGSGSGAQN